MRLLYLTLVLLILASLYVVDRWFAKHQKYARMTRLDALRASGWVRTDDASR